MRLVTRPGHLDTTVVVVSFENAAAIRRQVCRVALRLIQTLSRPASC